MSVRDIEEFRQFVKNRLGRMPYTEDELRDALASSGRKNPRQYARESPAEGGNSEPRKSDVNSLVEAKVDEALATSVAKNFSFDKNVTRADFRYRECGNVESNKPDVPQCQNCSHYGKHEALKDRLGECELFRTLYRNRPGRFQLMPDVGAHMVCDAWSGELNDRGQSIAAETLAHHYADYWNHLRDLGMEPSIEESQYVDDELDGSGWGINWDGKQWDVQEYPEQYYNQNEPRTPKGGVTVNGKTYRAGVWVPLQGDVPASEQEKVEQAKQHEVRQLLDRQKKLASEKVDRGTLKAELKSADASFSDAELRSIDYGYRALKRHHGDLVLNRLGQLIRGVLDRIKSVQDPEQQKRMNRRLAAYKIMFDRADADFPEGQ